MIIVRRKSLTLDKCHTGLHSATDSSSDCKSRDREFESQFDYITFVEIDHEIISTAIFLLPLIQGEQLSVTSERKYTSNGLPFTGL